MKTERIAIIMAGGSGERFWPLSRKKRPKQLLPLTNRVQSVLAEAVERVARRIPLANIYIATGEHLVEPIREAGLGIPDTNILAEPCKRNTAGCLAYATARILAERGATTLPPEDRELQQRFTVAVLTADHAIGDQGLFLETVETVMAAAEGEHALATIGVKPTRPETGYGYIEIREKERLSAYGDGIGVYPVGGFHEKPSLERAQAFVNTGRYYWNAGMFFWNMADFMAELEAVRPDFARAIIDMAHAMRKGNEKQVRETFEGLPNISIDCALMELARRVLVARAEFAWDDIGSWTALERAYEADDSKNVVVGNPVTVDCQGCIVYRDAAAAERDMAVAVVGAENLVVVVTDDAVLVVPKDRAQDVKKAVAELGRRNAKQL